MSCTDLSTKKNETKIYSINDLTGDWVNIKYLKSVQTSRSAKLSQESCEYNFVRFHNDTVLIILHFHEGIDLKLDSLDKNIFNARYNNDSIVFHIYNDTLLMNFEKTKDTFISYQMTVPRVLYSNRLLNREIFSGIYNVIDSANKTITFSENGDVSGFDKFKMYTVLDDYNDSGCNFDVIFLNNNPRDRSNEYTWTYSKDTLCIYDLDCVSFDSVSNYCYDNKIGKLIYKLKKQ